MHRRTALKLLGSTLALSSLQGKTVADEKAPSWKIGLGLNGFASASKKYKKTFPIWEVLDFASRTGFDGIELTGDWPTGDYPKSDETGRVAALKRLYDAFGLLMNGSTGRPHEMLKRIGVENIGYVHFTDTDGTLRDGGTSKHLACGDGHIDVEAALTTLAEGGFRGWIDLDTWQVPDPYDAARKGHRVVRRAMTEP